MAGRFSSFNTRASFGIRAVVVLSPVLPFLTFNSGCAEQFTTARRSREQGMGLYRENNFGDAAGAYRNAIRQDPRDFVSHYYLGVCYDELGQHQQAFAQYRTSLDVMATTLGGKGEDEFRLQVLETMASSIARYDTREVELTALENRAAAEQSAELWFIVGKTYRIKGDADKAIDAYRRSVYYDMNNFAVRKEYGMYLLSPLNQRQDAEVQLRAAWKLNGGDESVVTALHRLGATDVRVAGYQEARPARPPVTPRGSAAQPASTTTNLPPVRTVEVPKD